TGARPALESPGAHSSGPFRERYCEQSLRVDALLQLAESGDAHQFVEFLLRTPAHDPRRALAMARQSARDELELRVPWLAGVDKKSARFDSSGQSAERFKYSIIFRKEFEEARNNADGRLRLEGRQSDSIESVALLEPGVECATC